MLEVELKFRQQDWTPLQEKLAEWGARPAPTRRDSDHYFNAPDRDFRLTDEAVRLRRVGLQNFLTYKGPKIDSTIKTRVEVELPLADGATAAATAVRFLSGLGYQPVSVVTKTRQIYTLDRDGFRVEICLDDVGAVGKYVELEIQASEANLDAARNTLHRLAAELGLTETERRSYLTLLLEQSAVRASPPKNN